MEQNDEEERFAKLLRPSRFIRWLITWDFETAFATIVIVLVICGGLTLLASYLPAGEEEEAHARKLLQSQGATDIQFESLRLFECGTEDIRSKSVHFKALSKSSGMRLEGAVCCGWIKNCTIRFSYE